MQVCFSIPSFSRAASGTGMHRVVTSDLSNRKRNALVECNGDLVAPMDRAGYALPARNEVVDGWITGVFVAEGGGKNVPL